MVCHWRRRYMPQTHPEATLSLTHNDNQHIIQLHHKTFQNTIGAPTSLTVILFDTGKPYTFGLNHRGQCGIGRGEHPKILERNLSVCPSSVPLNAPSRVSFMKPTSLSPSLVATFNSAKRVSQGSTLVAATSQLKVDCRQSH
jgi:hypothetical protein